MRAASLPSLLLVLASLALCGCNPQTTGAVAPATPVVMPASFQPAGTSGPSGGLAAQPIADYLVGPLDVLDVSVFQVPDLARTVQVSANGQINLPLIGTVAAAGKTVADLQADIAAKYSATYLQAPQVSVFVRDAQSQRITINGEVNKPGVYPTAGPTTLVQIIATAGGTTDLADNSGVVVIRKVGQARSAAKFDLSAIQTGAAPDPVLAGGDTVVIDRSGMKAAFKSVRETLPVFGVFSPLL